MLKKIIAILVIGGAIGIGMIPVIATMKSESAFKKPAAENAPDEIKDAIEMKMRIFMFDRAQTDAEHAAILYPESEHFDYFVYYAGVCAQHNGKDEAARYWFERFAQLFPEHSWIEDVKKRYESL